MNKYLKYLELLKTKQDDFGFIESHECDSLLFSGLIGSCENVQVNIDAAYHELRDEWWRRPISYDMCYNPDITENKENFFIKLIRMAQYKISFPLVPVEQIYKQIWYKGSTISRDMLLGLAYYAWYNKRLDISENIINKAFSNFGVMGRGDPARINIMLPLLSTFAWISYRLGGPSRKWLRIFNIPNYKTTDFRAHLQVLHILLRKELSGKINKGNEKILKYHSKRQPNNPLFRFASGEKAQALRLLKDTFLWPENRLPNTRDRKESWIIQRDYGINWIGRSGEAKEHSGGDYVFLYSLIEGKMKK